MVYYIGIGSNIGNRLSHLRKAVSLIKKIKGTVLKRASPVYETKPVGGPQGQKDYLNAVLEIECFFEPVQLLLALQAIERQVGRKPRGARWAAREVDLDILLCGNRIVNEGRLVIPHPRMHERAFVLNPLNDLGPGLKHPVLKKTVSWLFDQMNQIGRVEKIEEIVSID